MRAQLLIALALFIASVWGASTSMPTANLTNWRIVFTDDFVTPVALGSFPGPYSNKWTSYTGFGDTSGVGYYDMYKVLSVSNGTLDYYMHTDSSTGKPLGAAPVPFIYGYWGGMVYGRYSLRFRSDSLPNYGTGWLLWPDSNNWEEGEIDFPEGSLDGTIHGYVHCVGDPQTNCFGIDTGVTFTNWHIATIEWTPTYVRFILDDVVIGTSTNAVPTTPFHMVLQAATIGVKPAASVSGHIKIDWLSIWAWDPTAIVAPTSTSTPTPAPTPAPCGTAQGVWTDSLSTLNSAKWYPSNGEQWGQTVFKSSQATTSSQGLVLTISKSGCPSACSGLAQQSGRITATSSYSTGAIQFSTKTSADAILWIGWEANSPRDGYEVQISGTSLAVIYYKNSAYNYGGYFTLPFDSSAAVHKFTVVRTNTKFEVYADGANVYSTTGSNLPTSSGPISFTLQADNAITPQSSSARISSFTYLPAGCPYTA